jgi:hypothetical protein
MTYLPINGKPYKNVDSISNTLTSDELVNGYSDESGSSVKFPGVESFVDLGTGPNTGVDGIFWWPNISKYIAISDGRTFTIDNKWGDFTEITGSFLIKKSPVSFAYNSTIAVLANGGKMSTTDGTTVTAEITDTAAPIHVTHVDFFDTYILANDTGTSRLWFSQVNDPLDWDALNFVSPEAFPDNLDAFVVHNEEIDMLGAESLQAFYNDGVTPFIKIPGGLTERGISAKYSLSKLNNTIYWLDNDKRFVKLTGRSAEIISTPFDKYLSGLTDISDANAFNVTVDGKHFYIINFKIENITLGYNYFLDSWFRLGEWDSTRGKFDRWLGNCYAKSVPWNLDLIGSRKDGKIYKLTSNSTTSIDNPIRFVRTTGHIDHGTNKVKLSKRLRIRIKRGFGLTTTAPVVKIRYKDNNELSFSNYIEGDLGNLGDTEMLITFEPLGSYVTRQYEIVITDNVPFV